MFVQFCIVHVSGLVLWQDTPQPAGYPIDQLLTLLHTEKRLLSSPHPMGQLRLYHAQRRDLGLYAVGTMAASNVHPGSGEIVEAMLDLFIMGHEGSIRVLPYDYNPEVYAPFANTYKESLRKFVTQKMTKPTVQRSPQLKKGTKQKNLKDESPKAGGDDFLQNSVIDVCETCPDTTPKGNKCSVRDSSTSSSFWGRLGDSVFGRKTNADFLRDLRRNLLDKNVAVEVSDELVKCVERELAGGDITGDSKTRVQNVLSKNIADILCFEPDAFLRAAKAATEERRAGKRSKPFTVCLTGVNGVGKTTTIAKLTYLLREAGLSTLICACDSFRSGAIEQLETHCNRLGATLFTQGYGKNASSIAMYGVKEAESKDIDVCLIDTTGRQYNNGPLMQALGALLCENSPDMTLFVGEALTGNEGVEQLRQFDEALRTATDGKRRIDGVILTKLDTCGDKIGATLNICYVCHVPILFVGIGQNYPDFGVLDPKDIATLLTHK
ncbi:Signal recognition particle receptor [Giardia muris]|uniref:Signal recognition particle receptor subunit alpha homolog n=1 Tax=Giardia muris TaxID=5742 RepID=A0A4Z1SQE5_GIAMU|nr:Signal recognition particle receptor [Giardia muris]|eukprot:TNJ28072.1 Signal recognition particle receptor [Giardia muris]